MLVDWIGNRYKSKEKNPFKAVYNLIAVRSSDLTGPLKIRQVEKPDGRKAAFWIGLMVY
jgi:hypothetical protein